MVRLTVLGSGSSGNCAVVSTGKTTLLIDAGLSAKQICLRLAEVGLTLEAISGILLTHEHLDHTAGLGVLSGKLSLPLYCTALTQEVLLSGIPFRTPPRWRIMDSSGRFEIGDLRIECFSVPHDAVDPIGFVIADDESRLGVLSDVGHVTHLIKERLRHSDSLFIEANYDVRMLEADTKRPWPTKQRISSRHGHLSNDQAAELVEEIGHAGLNHVLLGHLSDDCNCPDRAAERLAESLRRGGAHQAHVACAHRHRVTPTIQAGRERPAVVGWTAPATEADAQPCARRQHQQLSLF